MTADFDLRCDVLEFFADKNPALRQLVKSLQFGLDLGSAAFQVLGPGCEFELANYPGAIQSRADIYPELHRKDLDVLIEMTISTKVVRHEDFWQKLQMVLLATFENELRQVADTDGRIAFVLMVEVKTTYPREKV